MALATALAACGGRQAESEPSPPAAPQETTEEDTLPRGGTLRGATASAFPDLKEFYFSADWAADYTLDPQVAYDATSWELFRCCLLRTLMSFKGQPTSRGGAELRPDLAREMPEVSADGLTWTFRIKSGIRYAPP